MLGAISLRDVAPWLQVAGNTNPRLGATEVTLRHYVGHEEAEIQTEEGANSPKKDQTT